MKTSKGVIQGYDGVAMVDAKHQVVVHAEAFGAPQEQELLFPMIEGTRENFNVLGTDDVFKETKLTADSGYHSEKNMEKLADAGIDAYVADPQMRKRDPRFTNRDRYKERFNKDRLAYYGTISTFPNDQFMVSDDKTHCICPAGKRLHRNGNNVTVRGYKALKFRSNKTDCISCPLRRKCLRHPDRSETRQVYFFKESPKTFMEQMKQKIDSTRGRLIYHRRLATVEPVFAHIRSTLGLDRFTLRGKKKVNIQWSLFCIVHNLLKIHRYGEVWGVG
jgi:hypothetical protein